MLCYKCADTFIQTVERGKMYLLRIINAALNDELFFAIDNHTLTVVEADADKPLMFLSQQIKFLTQQACL